MFVLWFVVTIGIFAASLAAGGTRAVEAVSNDQRSKYEAGEAYVVYNAANTQSAEQASQQFLLIVSNSSGTVDDPTFTAAIADIVSRLGALQATVDGATGPVFRPARRATRPTRPAACASCFAIIIGPNLASE